MARLSSGPSIDSICKSIIGYGAIEAREWAAAQPEESFGRVMALDYTRRYYEAGAARCWFGEFRSYSNRRIGWDNIVVELPTDPDGRKLIRSFLAEHQYVRSNSYENPDAYHEPESKYFGEKYALFRHDKVPTLFDEDGDEIP